MSDVIAIFGWRDAVDVVLVAIIAYRVLVMFRGTRAVQMLIGVGVLVAATILARRFELRSLAWVLDGFWSFWAIVLVVLFQPELRRAVARLGQGRVLRAVMGAPQDEWARVVNELVTVTQLLAVRRIGALLVVERAGGLRNYAELGVPVDALVSADLLESIFLPYSPLHDGAVVIEGTRLVAAGCFLPLSRNVEIGRQLGSRHRAALGISEETDAAAIVVSEETGRVSLAVEGRIEIVSDAEALRRRLRELMEGAPAAGAPSWWRGVRRLLARAEPQL